MSSAEWIRAAPASLTLRAFAFGGIPFAASQAAQVSPIDHLLRRQGSPDVRDVLGGGVWKSGVAGPRACADPSEIAHNIRLRLAGR